MDQRRFRNISLEDLLAEVRRCRACEKMLPFAPRPVLRASSAARVLIVGQAPGTRVHQTGLPWNDPSGDRLRLWMGVDRETFYDESLFAIIPMGFCYPGKGKSGDLPPRRECAELWQSSLLEKLPAVELKILCGQYAARHYLGKRMKAGMSETVKAWEEYVPEFIVLPHPSPRNMNWFRQNPWLESEIVPFLRKRVQKILES